MRSDNGRHLGGKWLNEEEILEDCVCVCVCGWCVCVLAGRRAAAGARGVCNKHNCFGQAGLSHQMMCFGDVHLSCSHDQHSAAVKALKKTQLINIIVSHREAEDTGLVWV